MELWKMSYNIYNHGDTKLIFHDLNSFHRLSDALRVPPRYSHVNSRPECYLTKGRKAPVEMR